MSTLTPKRFYHTPRPLGKVISKVMTPIMRKNGFADINIVTDWPKIVGERLGKYSQPLKIDLPPRHFGEDTPRKPGVLHIQTSSSVALELQHSYVQIVERVNGYFGYQAVGKIKLIAKPGFRVQKKEPPPLPRNFEEKEILKSEEKYNDLSNPTLRRALAELELWLFDK